MNSDNIVKKKNKHKPFLKKGGLNNQKNKFPTLAHIVLKCGLVVEIPELPMNISRLTSYDHMRIALEHAALAISCLNQLETGLTPKLAMWSNLHPIRLNLEDLMNHLYWAIEVFQRLNELS